VMQEDVGQQRRDHPSNNLAKLPLELAVKLQRERLLPRYGEGFRGAPLLIDQASGDRRPEDGGVDAPAQQDRKGPASSGEP
jgi:hypothetical protein